MFNLGPHWKSRFFPCITHTHTYTHTTVLRPSWILSGTTWVSRHQKGKTNLDLLEQEIVSGSGINWAVCKSAPWPRHITMPASHHSDFTGWMPFLLPNKQRQSTENNTSIGLTQSNVNRFSNFFHQTCSHHLGFSKIFYSKSHDLTDNCRMLPVFNYQPVADSLSRRKKRDINKRQSSACYRHRRRGWTWPTAVNSRQRPSLVDITLGASSSVYNAMVDWAWGSVSWSTNSLHRRCCLSLPPTATNHVTPQTYYRQTDQPTAGTNEPNQHQHFQNVQYRNSWNMTRMRIIAASHAAARIQYLQAAAL